MHYATTLKSTQSNTYTAANQFRHRIQAKYQPLVLKAVQQQEHAFINYANVHGVPQAQLNINTIVTGKPLEVVLRNMYHDIAKKWGWYMFRNLRAVKGYFQDSIVQQLLDAVNAYFDRWVLNFITDMTNTTKKFIIQQILLGIENGDSFDETAKSIIDSNINKYRAQMIVRTESVRSQNAVSLESAKKTGIKMLKIWNSAQDNRTRRVPRDEYDHLHLNGQKVGLDDKFVSQTKDGVVFMDYPGDPTAPAGEVIQCRCSISFEPQRDSNGRVIRN